MKNFRYISFRLKYTRANHNISSTSLLKGSLYLFIPWGEDAGTHLILSGDKAGPCHGILVVSFPPIDYTLDSILKFFPVLLPKPIRNLIEEFHKLPGIGPKMAGRLTFFLLHRPESEIQRFGEALINLKKDLTFCKTCQNISETEQCSICVNPERDPSIICIVSEPLDIVALEKSKMFQGVYHVLHGALSPLDNIGPDDLRIAELMERLQNPEVKEIILATNATLEGEATASFIQQKVKNLPIKITRIARGIPVGGDIEYADETTLMRAIEGRMNY